MNQALSRRPRRRRSLALATSALLAAAAAATVLAGGRASSHPVEPAALGVARAASDMEALLGEPGPIAVQTVVAADWRIDRGGMINLAHPRARAAGLRDGVEPIQIYFHALRHPTRGLFLVDTGVERALARDPPRAAIRGPVAGAMHLDALRAGTDTASWLAAQPDRPAGVLLTHLHLDHVSGLPDVPAGVPVYAGPGETAVREAVNLVLRPSTDRALAGKGAIREWQFSPDPSGAFAGLLDVFGDGSLWAISVPGHTPGSTAFLARTPRGPVLFTGDACHTAWGWANDVEPGPFSHDREQSAESLARLRALVARHPEIDVRLGHQPFAPARDGVRAGAAAAP